MLLTWDMTVKGVVKKSLGKVWMRKRDQPMTSVGYENEMVSS